MPVLRRTLLVATVLLAALALAWLWLWLELTQSFGNQTVLHQAGALAFLVCGPSTTSAAALVGWWRPRAAGWLLTLGGIGASIALWRTHIPDYGAAEGLWCLGVAMVALGAGWFTVAAASQRVPPRSRSRRYLAQDDQMI